MRKVLLIATAVVFGVAGVAYAAVGNVYVLTSATSVKPIKSGTLAKPTPVGATIAFTVSTVPANQRPNAIKKLRFSIPGVVAHGDAFPVCGTSRLNDAAEGPKTCPAGSKIGTGHFLAEFGKSSSQAPAGETSCRVEISVYNGGAGTLSYYVYGAPTVKGDCPVTPRAFAATVAESGGSLVQNINIPSPLLHPIAGVTSAIVNATVTIPAKSRKVGGKKIGLLASVACPLNHTRVIKARFTLENNTSRLVTRGVACK